ncbi:MAG: tRNA (adenosine(37)-N6)-threonylcarbamoyltransferase complex ATPase subunit type 1 TsaE [Elusimicrobia bacterium]|nr:tRNA (adenosine(37)-N6)-threonylcarbamoyltransferase complex ATPase subunit type 1 TsaE [Candidatus Liberimonas magnetica]
MSSSAKQTIKVGKDFSKLLKTGDLVCLSGELGSGKTTFAKGIARGFGIKEFVRSSSFVIVNEYKTKNIKLYHIDLYRLTAKSLKNVGLEEYLNTDGVSIIEWAEKINYKKLHGYWDVKITWLGDKKRKIAASYNK